MRPPHLLRRLADLERDLRAGAARQGGQRHREQEGHAQASVERMSPLHGARLSTGSPRPKAACSRG